MSGFQFFMGDLGNFVPYANRAPASDPFKVTCKFNTSRAEKELKISRYNEHQLYVSVPEACSISYKDKAIIEMELDVNMVVRLVIVALFSLESPKASGSKSSQQACSDWSGAVSTPTISSATPTLPVTR